MSAHPRGFARESVQPVPQGVCPPEKSEETQVDGAQARETIQMFLL